MRSRSAFSVFAAVRALSLALALFMAGLLAPATVAWAQGAPGADAASPAVKAEARERFDRGLHLFETGENAGALAEFKRAFQLIPNPLVLYNMGLVYAAMNRPVDAVDALGQFLASPGAAGPDQKLHGEQVRAEQSKRIALLVVLTEHPATIEIDGVEVGHTPLSTPVRVGSGSHVVAVEAAGFLGSRREVTLAGQITETISMAMQPSDTRMAQLVVTAVMPGAEVVVNGKRVGATPLPASIAVPPGKVKVEVQRAGYLTATQTITLDEGAHGDLTFLLEEDPAAAASVKGRLVVTASEPGADVIVDGGARRSLAGPLLVPVGPHRLRVEKAGFEPLERNVEVVSGQDASVSLTLVATFEMQSQLDSSRHTRRVAGWSLLVAGVAVVAGGAVFAVIASGDRSTAQSHLDAVIHDEMTVGSLCFKGPLYEAHGCPPIRAAAEDDVKNAKYRLWGGLAAAGLGAVSAGVGGYLLATEGEKVGAGVKTAQVWSTGQGDLGFLVGGRF